VYRQVHVGHHSRIVKKSDSVVYLDRQYLRDPAPARWTWRDPWIRGWSSFDRVVYVPQRIELDLEGRLRSIVSGKSEGDVRITPRLPYCVPKNMITRADGKGNMRIGGHPAGSPPRAGSGTHRGSQSIGWPVSGCGAARQVRAIDRICLSRHASDYSGAAAPSPSSAWTLGLDGRKISLHRACSGQLQLWSKLTARSVPVQRVSPRQ